MNSIEIKVDEIFEKYKNIGYFAGGVCYIKQDHQDILLKAYGKQNSATNQPMNVDTNFDLASVTKTITSTLILKVISDGKLTLETALKDCLPRVAENKVLAPITIQQLLTHSSGLVAWYPFYTVTPKTDLFTILDSIELDHQEEKAVVYSDLNYILLGEILKHHYQSNLQSVLEKEIISPLQLESFSYGPLSDGNIAATEFGNQIEMEMCRSRNKTFSQWRSTSEPIVGEVNDGNTYYFFEGQSGHAGLFSSAKDLSRVIDLYLKGGMAKNTQIINLALINLSLQNIVENRGLGWHCSDPFPTGFGHTGFTGTSVWVVPEKQLQVVLLTNRLHVDQPVNINPFRKELHEKILSHFS